MDILLICIVSFIAAGLTLFSGFGLGTILMPVFAIFFPIELAVALTAIVHFLNNLFKLILMGKHTDKFVLLRFGIPAILFAAAGAYLLSLLSQSAPLHTYTIFNNSYQLLPVKIVMGLVILTFAILEGIPNFKDITFHKKYLIAGGALSGFFGGLSGHQGALRSAFISRVGLSKEAFIATGVVIACLVDLTRLTVYYKHITSVGITENVTLLILATFSGFAGVFAATRLLKKITLNTVQKLISIMLFITGLLMIAGII